MGLIDTPVQAVQSLQQKQKVIGGNIANSRSIAYKKLAAFFTDSFYETLVSAAASSDNDGGSNTPATQISSGTRISAIRRKFTQGPISKTSDKNNLAIKGDNSFFRVKDPVSNLEFVTRDGNLRRDDKSYITMQNGFRLQGGVPSATMTFKAEVINGTLKFTPVTPSSPTWSVGDIRVKYDTSVGSGIDTGDSTNQAALIAAGYTDDKINSLAPKLQDYAFNSSGELIATTQYGDKAVIAQVLLTSPSDPQGLEAKEGGLYSFGAAGMSEFSHAQGKPGTNALGIIEPSSLEYSNVEITEEFAEMIVNTNDIKANVKAATTADEILREILNMKR